MATLSGLVKVIAVVQGLDENQVHWIARYLREAGLISQGGRGRGGAKMTVTDAANLLIGVNAPGAPKDSVALVKVFYELALTRDDAADPDPDVWASYAEEPFKRGSPFGPALEYMISRYKEVDWQLSNDIARIELSGPKLSASIYSGASVVDRASDVMLSAFFGQDESSAGKIFPDQNVSKSFSERTLTAVAKALSA